MTFPFQRACHWIWPQDPSTSWSHDNGREWFLQPVLYSYATCFPPGSEYIPIFYSNGCQAGLLWATHHMHMIKNQHLWPTLMPLHCGEINSYVRLKNGCHYSREKEGAGRLQYKQLILPCSIVLIIIHHHMRRFCQWPFRFLLGTAYPMQTPKTRSIFPQNHYHSYITLTLTPTWCHVRVFIDFYAL